jgi:hypothetical protein
LSPLRSSLAGWPKRPTSLAFEERFRTSPKPGGGGAQPESSGHNVTMSRGARTWRRAGIRPASRRFRAVIAGGLLLAALGASACTAHSSPQTKDLPVAVASTIKGVRPISCTLNEAGSRVLATGKFEPSASLPVVAGQQVGALQLHLSVFSSKSIRFGHIVIHNPVLGGSYEGVSVGQTSWHISTTVRQSHDTGQIHCALTYGVFL